MLRPCTTAVLTSAAGALALALALAPTAAGSAAGIAPIPAPAKGAPAVLAAGASGASIVAWSSDALYGAYGPVTVDTIGPAPTRERRRWSTGRSLLVSSARDHAGHLDLLTVRQTGTAPAGAAGRFVLYRARQGGRVQRLWTGGRGSLGAVARRGSRVAVAWIERVRVGRLRADRQVLRLTTKTGDGRFTRSRAIAGVLPTWINQDDPAFVSDLDLTLDRDGNPVVALTAWHRPAPTLVLATLTRTGRVRSRQLTTGVSGLVEAQTTRAGRVAVVVEDTGIEGEGGECVGDGEGRKIWATVREPRAARFARVQRLESHPLQCAATGPELLTTNTEQIAVLWSRSPEMGLPTAHLALAERGARFQAPVMIAQGALLGAATYRHPGMLFVLTTRPMGPTDVYGGPLVIQALTSGSGVGPVQPVDLAGAGRVLADTPAGGSSSLVAWQPRVGVRELRLAYVGGQ